MAFGNRSLLLATLYVSWIGRPTKQHSMNVHNVTPLDFYLITMAERVGERSIKDFLAAAWIHLQFTPEVRNCVSALTPEMKRVLVLIFCIYHISSEPNQKKKKNASLVNKESRSCVYE
jgi:hypothetical protein